MTPEEKAVIQAAITWRRQLAQLFATSGSSIPDHDLAHTVDELMASRVSSDPEPQWVPATFADCLAGDRIRIGQEETDVLWTSGPQQFHARNREWTGDDGKVRDHTVGRWDHIEVRMDLSANPGRREYVPSTACEILCTPERAAALMLNAKPVDK